MPLQDVDYTVINIGVSEMKKTNIFCLPRLYLYDQKDSKKDNIVIYYFKLKYVAKL